MWIGLGGTKDLGSPSVLNYCHNFRDVERKWCDIVMWRFPFVTFSDLLLNNVY